MLKLAIFDLDGVIVDTAKYHYLAWKEIAKKFNYNFTEEENEAFKGVSRLACMDILIKLAKKEEMPQDERIILANQKNDIYLSLIQNIDETELLQGVVSTLDMFKSHGVKIALGSASKNAMIILEKTGIINKFDVVIDGNLVSKAKPDPEVFVMAADKLQIDYKDCVVFEDAFAGVQAALNANMKCIGIGLPENLPNAKIVLKNVGEFTFDLLISLDNVAEL